jgi:hypothetical protein
MPSVLFTRPPIHSSHHFFHPCHYVYMPADSFCPSFSLLQPFCLHAFQIVFPVIFSIPPTILFTCVPTHSSRHFHSSRCSVYTPAHSFCPSFCPSLPLCLHDRRLIMPVIFSPPAILFTRPKIHSSHHFVHSHCFFYMPAILFTCLPFRSACHLVYPHHRRLPAISG